MKRNFLKIFIIVLGGVVLGLLFLPFFKNGRIILGAEGSYFTDFSLFFKNFFASWYNSAFGIPATSLNFGYVFHLVFLQKLLQNERLVNFVMIYSQYFLPILAVYLLGLELNLSPLISLLVALFYLANPFMSVFLFSLNQWNMLVAYILPAFLWLVLRFYYKNWKLFFFFGLHSLFFSFTNANPPSMVLYQIALILFVIFASLYKEKKFHPKAIAGKYCLVLFSFILFNFWWILNWFYVLPDAQQGYTKEFAISWLRGRQIFIPAFWRVLNFRNLLSYSSRPDFHFLEDYFSEEHILIFLSFPVFLILYFWLKKTKNPQAYYLLGLFWIVVGFLAKGVKGLFGQGYEFMVYRFPFFHLFKTAEEKWGLLFVFLTTLLVIVVLKEIRKEKVFRFFFVFLLISVGFFLYPFLTGNFLPDYKFNEVVIGSKRFLDKSEYKELKNKLNNDLDQYRVLSLPGSWNYQVALQIEGNKFYTGNDPVLSNTSKPFIAPYTGTFTQRFGVLFDKISQPDYLKLLGLYNIKKIVINKDMYPWFGFRPKESVAELEEIFDRKLAGEKNKQSLLLHNEVIDLYDVGEYFLPRFYVPTQVIYSPQSTQYELPELVSFNDISQRPALFISPYEKIKEEDKFTNDLIKEKSGQIILVGELQSVIDEAKLRSGIRGMNPGGVLFPYARWKPGSLIYPYILEKEEKTKNQILGQPEELLRQNLFFAGKRVFEIQRWNRGLSDEDFLDVLERYEKEMNGAVENSEKIRMAGKDAFWFLAEIGVSFEAFTERLLDVVEGDFGKKSQRLKLAEEAVERIGKIIREVLKHYSQARYYFEVPEEGEYEVLLEKKEGIFDWKIENVTPKEEEKFTLGIASEQKEKTWLSFGKQKFNVQEYIMVLNQTSSRNLLNEDWNILESNVEVEEITKLFGKESTPTVWQEIKNWEPETGYKLSFKYKTPVGRLKLSLIEEKERIDTTWFDKGVIGELPDKTNVLLKEELISKNSSEWKEYSIVVYSGKNAKTAKLFISPETNLFIFSESEKEKLFEEELKEAVLTKIIEPNMILRKKNDISYPDIPQITFQKINPTKYVLEITNASQPYFLVFSESFHRGWKVYINGAADRQTDIIASYFDGAINEKKPQESWFDKKFYETWGKKPLENGRHLLINGYANAWYLTPEDIGQQADYEIIIEYWPQRLFYLGALVTLLTIMGSLVFWLLKK